VLEGEPWLTPTAVVVAICAAVLVASAVWITEGEERSTLGIGEDADGRTAHALRRRLDEAFAPPFVAAGDIDVGASLGLALYPDDADTLDRLLTVSDAAMYADKQRRRSLEHR
jgi:predicted signal transduction protein with EAL and GGDEF domain